MGPGSLGGIFQNLADFRDIEFLPLLATAIRTLQGCEKDVLFRVPIYKYCDCVALFWLEFTEKESYLTAYLCFTFYLCI